jgi:lycopene cyclase domain-containing protein
VTNRHWFFADSYTLGFRILQLPFEEIHFFFSVPFACLFTWEMVKRHATPDFLEYKIKESILFPLSILFVLMSILFIFIGKEYTALAGLFFVASLLYDKIFGASILTSNKFLYFFVLITIFTLIFNGYLTWRPIVTYDEIYQLDFRIFTIPIEDFFFGYALLIICTSLYQKMVGKKNT